MRDLPHLDWPFFDESHRDLAERLERWCEAHLADDHPADVDSACRILVRKLGEGGWLRYCVPRSHGGIHDSLDVRSLASYLAQADLPLGLARDMFMKTFIGAAT